MWFIDCYPLTPCWTAALSLLTVILTIDLSSTLKQHQHL